MSAFIVNRTHLDYLVTAAFTLSGRDTPRWFWNNHWHELEYDNATQLGTMLAAENHASVTYRYPSLSEAEMADSPPIEPYTFRRYPRRPDPIQVLKAIACYEYQSCEHPGWEQSQAHAFCQALREQAIWALPGMDKAHWEIPERGESPQ